MRGARRDHKVTFVPGDGSHERRQERRIVAQVRVKKLESMYKMVKMMETDHTLEAIDAPRENG